MKNFNKINEDFVPTDLTGKLELEKNGSRRFKPEFKEIPLVIL